MATKKMLKKSTPRSTTNAYKEAQSEKFKQNKKPNLVPIKDRYPAKSKEELTPIKDRYPKVDKNKLSTIRDKSTTGVNKDMLKPIKTKTGVTSSSSYASAKKEHIAQKKFR